jgi:protein SCO1
VRHAFDIRRRPGTAIVSAIAVACFCLLLACGPSRGTNDAKVPAKDTSAKRYKLTGRVVSVDKATNSINVDGDEVPGFMAAMTMPYQVRDTSILDKLAPGDQIKAEIVVGNDGAYLENIVVVQKASAPNPTK